MTPCCRPRSPPRSIRSARAKATEARQAFHAVILAGEPDGALFVDWIEAEAGVFVVDADFDTASAELGYPGVRWPVDPFISYTDERQRVLGDAAARRVEDVKLRAQAKRAAILSGQGAPHA